MQVRDGPTEPTSWLERRTAGGTGGLKYYGKK